MLHPPEAASAALALPDFLAAGGEVGRRIREKDWTATPLGAPSAWPEPLRAALRIVLASRQPLALWWGADCTLLFNDACSALLGAAADGALGAPVPAAWIESPALRVASPEGDRHFLLSSSPVPGEGGNLGGVLCTLVDVTAAVIAERELAIAEAFKEVARELAADLDTASLMQTVADSGRRVTGAAFVAFRYDTRDADGKPVELHAYSGAPCEAFERFGAPQGRPPVRSFLAVPVVSRSGSTLGGLFFGHPDADVFDERAGRHAAAMASHAAAALDNAQLFARTREEIERRVAMERALAQRVEVLTRLHDLALRLGGMTELQSSLQAILDAAVDGQGADFGLVWLHDRGTDSLVVRASRNFDAEALQYFARVMPGPGGGAAGNAFAQQRRWIIEDVDLDPGFEPFRSGAHAAGFRSIHSTPIVTRAGQLLGVISVHFRSKPRPDALDMQLADVCARHAADVIEAFDAQEALRRSEHVYRAIGESIDHGVWVCDAAGRNTYASESFLRLTGITQEQCSGFGWSELLHPDDRDRTIAAWQKCVAEGHAWDTEHRLRGVDGQWHFVLARGVPVRDAGGGVVAWAGINLDIDRLKQVENELRELDQRKNEFLATLAHELRNPLAPLRNGLEVLRLAGSDTATAEKARGMMERQLAQMVRLLDDLLDVSRVSRGKIELRREEVELSTILRNAIETSGPLIAERGHRLGTDFPREPVFVHADVTRLAQVFWNLLNNAAKYTEPGGRIELAVRRVGDEVEVSVRDNGIGIPVEMQRRVFDIFTQVDRPLEKSQGGLGIGLSIAKRLVEMHGGSIRVASEGHGRGSEFVVRLPARAGARAGPSGAAPVAGAGGAGGKRILVADDEPDAAMTLAMLLETTGNTVRVAHDGSDAVELAATFRPEVVLLDITMPRLNGYDACRVIRAQPWARDAYIVALTGWGQPDDRKRARSAGFDCHLVKPVEPQALERLIREMPGKEVRAPAA